MLKIWIGSTAPDSSKIEEVHPVLFKLEMIKRPVELEWTPLQYSFEQTNFSFFDERVGGYFVWLLGIRFNNTITLSSQTEVQISGKVNHRCDKDRQHGRPGDPLVAMN